jgi:hypothetical protein
VADLVSGRDPGQAAAVIPRLDPARFAVPGPAPFSATATA